MNDSEKLPQAGAPSISPEAVIGIGITVAELGLLSLLLGSAELMRSVPEIAWIWLTLGAGLVVLGGLAATSAWRKKRRD
jgi:uncharacterized membrane protein HdeD (DUF308 family)